MKAVGLSALAAFLIDQVSKYLVIHGMNLAQRRSIDVLPPWLNFRYGENRGINFGLFGGGSEGARWFLIALALVICAALIVWLWRRRQPLPARIAAGVLIGGALANVLDRLLYGYVLDFLNNSLPGWENPFVYNVADIFIFAGAVGLILFTEDRKGAAGAGRKKPK